MSGDFFRVVSMNVAANPVARAIAKQAIESEIRLFLLQCYGLEEGTDQRENYLASARALMVAIQLLAAAGREPMPVMRGALSCCEQASKRRFTWKLVDAVAIDTGLVAARDVIKAATSRQLAEAWAEVRRVERAVEAAA